MQNYKLIVSDLDGTLLDSDMDLTSENLAALKSISELGIVFAVSSGRTFFEIPRFVRDNPYIRFITYSNGSAVYDRLSNTDIISNRMVRSSVNKALDILSDYDCFIAIHADGRCYIDRDITFRDFDHFQMNDYYKSLFLTYDRVEGIENFARAGDKVESIVLFFHSDEDLEKCSERIKDLDGVTLTSSIEHNIEICSSDAGKGKALSALAKILNIQKQEIISVGDNMNDTSMFSESGLSLCTSNGIKDAKALADKVICSNDEGIAKYILDNVISKS